MMFSIPAAMTASLPDPVSNAQIDAAERAPQRLAGQQSLAGECPDLRCRQTFLALITVATMPVTGSVAPIFLGTALVPAGMPVAVIAQRQIDSILGWLETGLLESPLQRARIALQELQRLDPVHHEPRLDGALIIDVEAHRDASEFSRVETNIEATRPAHRLHPERYRHGGVRCVDQHRCVRLG